MSEFFINLNLPNWLIVLIISAFPVVELRGAIPVGVHVLGMSYLKTIVFAIIGNILPVPLLLVFLNSLFKLSKKTFLKGIVERYEAYLEKKQKLIDTYGLIMLFLFVAIPLPGTGAWTGSILASLGELSFLRSFITIVLGVLGAALLVTLFTFFGIWGLVGAVVLFVLSFFFPKLMVFFKKRL